MKRYLIYLFIITSFFIIKIPPYKELNNIHIISEITVKCSNNYTVKLKEIIPVKKENGISYKYKYYELSNKDLKVIKENFDKKYHHSFFYQDVTTLNTNCRNDRDIKKIFNLPKIKKKK